MKEKPKLNYIHKELASGRWEKLSFLEQMANIGSDVERAMNWKNKDEKASNASFERALELIDLTMGDKKNRGRAKEIARVREFFIDYFLFENQYFFTDKYWRDYFYNFAYAANLNKFK